MEPRISQANRYLLVLSLLGSLVLSGCSSNEAETETTPASSTAEVSSTQPTETPVSTPTQSAPATPLSYTQPFTFDEAGVKGTITQVETPAEDLALAARDSGTDQGTWFAVELTNTTGAELRPQLINFHTADNQHFQAYGEVATGFTFAKNAPEAQSAQDVKTKYATEGPLAVDEAKTVYFYSPEPIPDGFDTATIQFLSNGGNLIIDLPANNL